jgi:hypothetical protein
MRCRIVHTFKGSPDGAHTLLYEAGAEAELPDSLADVAIAEGWAQALDGKAAEPPKNKAKQPPKNK